MNKPSNDSVLVPMGDKNSRSNPIMVALGENRSMGVLRYDVILQVGNFHTQEEAEKAAKKIVDLVEKKLGSRSIYGGRQ